MCRILMHAIRRAMVILQYSEHSLFPDTVLFQQSSSARLPKKEPFRGEGGGRDTGPVGCHQGQLVNVILASEFHKHESFRKKIKEMWVWNHQSQQSAGSSLPLVQPISFSCAVSKLALGTEYNTYSTLPPPDISRACVT